MHFHQKECYRILCVGLILVNRRALVLLPNLHAPSSVAIKSLSNFSPFSALTSTITPSLKVNVNPSIMLPLRFKGNLFVTYPLTLFLSGAVKLLL